MSTSEECRNYRRTKRGLIYHTYWKQCASSKKRNHPQPNYNKNELYNWSIKQKNFQKLFFDWEESGYLTKLKPSIDRINDYKSYTFENIHWDTWEYNYSKLHNDRLTGINNKVNHAIRDSNGNEYHSISEAKRQTGISHSSIRKVLKGERKTAGNLSWRYV